MSGGSAGWSGLVSFALVLLGLALFPPVLPGETEFDSSVRRGLLTAEEQRWLAAHPNIRVAATSEYRPVEFHDAAGRLWGMTAEYFNLIERRLGIHFQQVRLAPEQWSTLNPTDRGADVITASAETSNRAEYWSFTKPYLIFPTYLITRHGVKGDLTLAQLSGTRVAVVQGWAAEEYLRTQFPQVRIDPVPDAETGLRKVSFGLVDAFVSELPVATAAMEKEGIVNLKISGEAGYTYRLAISVRKDWPELRSILEKALATVSPGERDAIYRRWMKMSDPPNRLNERLRRGAIWGGTGLLAALALVLAWNRALASRVRERTSRLNEELAGRIEAGRALAASEDKFSKAFRSSPDAIFITRIRDGCVVEANAGAGRMYACTSDELIGQQSSGGDWGWISSSEREAFLARLAENGGSTHDFEARQRRKNGETFTAAVSCETVEVSGEPCLIAVLRDVTKQRESAAALATMVKRFEMVARATNDAVWDWDLESKSIWWYNGFHVLFGYRQEELEPGIESWTNRLHPEDRERASAGIYAVIRGDGTAWSDEYRFQRKDGSYADIFDRGYVIRDERGRAIRMIGAMQDISDRKRAQAALMESEERFAKAFRSSPLAMCLTTVDRGEIIEINDAFLRMYHFGDKRLAIGRTTRELGWWAAPESRESYVERLRNEGRILNLKRPFRRATGEHGVGLFSVEMVEFAGVPCAIILVNDITERERAEADRQRLFVQLLKAEDEERRRIARDLHDSTAQHLAAIQINLTRLRDAAAEPAPPQLLSDSLALVTQSVQEIRTLTYLLHPPLLDDLGLGGALADYVAGFAKRSGLRVELDASGYSGRLPHDTELALFRVAQECLTNVRRHSGSASALVRLDRDTDEVRLEVQDWGRGLPADAPLGVGLRGMQERIRQIGGELEIESDAEGTTVLASVPLADPPMAAHHQSMPV